MFATRKQSRNNPASTASVISVLFFSWLDPLMKKGFKRAIRSDDLFALADSNSTAYLSERLQRQWKQEMANGSVSEAARKPSFQRAVLTCFRIPIFITGFAVALEEAARVSQPLLLSYIIEYFYSTGSGASEEAERSSAARTYAFAAGLAAASMMSAMMHHPFYFYNSVIGMRMRIATCSLIYNKSLQLSHRSLAAATTGHVVTLMSTDAARFEQATSLIHYFWLAPLQAVVVLGILWAHIGVSSLSGYALVLLFIPLQGYLGKLFAKLRMRTAEQTDKRVQLMNQVLSGMKVIKMYCWERSFAKVISTIRRREMKSIEKMVALSMISYDFGYFTFSKLGVAACILATVWLHDRMPPVETIVVLMRLMGIVQDSLAYYLPQAVQIWSEMATSCSRTQEFLSLEEVEQTSAPILATPPERKLGGRAELNEFSGTWEGGTGAPSLQNATLSVAAGQLLAIVGPVGAGKSSALMAILGELPRAAGRRAVRGRLAYAAQEPWILSATVRQNVLFGAPFDAEWYARVIEACDLSKDVGSLADGDRTLVGERGVILSGGQRTRLGLARALYQDADVYLLDDPLSAVDAEVASHIFDRCIRGLLADRACVLVTHQLRFVREATEVLVIVDGRVAQRGSYDELASRGVDFAKMMKTAAPGDDGGSLATEAAASEASDPPTLRTAAAAADRMPGGAPVSAADDVRFVPVGDGTASDEDGSRRREAEPSYDDPLLKHGKDACSVDVVDVAAAALSVAALAHQANEPEYIEEGGVAYITYRKYFGAGGNVAAVLVFVLLMIGGQAGFIAIDWYLTEWSHDGGGGGGASVPQESAAGATGNSTQLDRTISGFAWPPPPRVVENPQIDLFSNGSRSFGNGSLNSSHETEVPVASFSAEYLYGYVALVVGVVALSVLRSVAFYKITVAASKRLHDAMFSAVVRAPMRFFDTNPTGRILNRFSNDTGNMDDLLPGNFFDFVTTFMLVLGTVIMAATANPWVLIPLVPILVALVIVRKVYVTTSRAVKRLEAVSRSPVLSHASASLAGLITVRAFSAQDAFIKEFNMNQDSHTEAFYLFLCINRWFAIRLDCMCVTFIASMTFLCIVAKESSIVDPSLFALAISYVISMTAIFQWVVTQSIEVENMMTSVERVTEYAELPPEAPLASERVRPPPGWPRVGSIEARRISLRYSADGPLVLKDVSFSIAGSEKVGVCGRTGAGKSSLLAALFRLSEPRGYLAIDGVAIADVGLHDLRAAVSIIPQDPVLFDGTVRSNLDPFSERDDGSLWDALRQTLLAGVVRGLPGGLDAAVSGGGANLSVGQRQLLCLARALLRNNRVLVVDEATANVDPRTSAEVQETIGTKFRSCTVLTIAHRLHTIMDSDRVMVMEDGQLMEFDEPHALLQKPDSLLSSLVRHAGDKEAQLLVELAKAAYEARRRPAATADEAADEDLAETEKEAAVKLVNCGSDALQQMNGRATTAVI